MRKRFTKQMLAVLLCVMAVMTSGCGNRSTNIEEYSKESTAVSGEVQTDEDESKVSASASESAESSESLESSEESSIEETDASEESSETVESEEGITSERA